MKSFWQALKQTKSQNHKKNLIFSGSLVNLPIYDYVCGTKFQVVSNHKTIAILLKNNRREGRKPDHTIK